jgi:hypothetical protein
MRHRAAGLPRSLILAAATTGLLRPRAVAKVPAAAENSARGASGSRAAGECHRRFGRVLAPAFASMQQGNLRPACDRPADASATRPIRGYVAVFSRAVCFWLRSHLGWALLSPGARCWVSPALVLAASYGAVWDEAGSPRYSQRRRLGATEGPGGRDQRRFPVLANDWSTAQRARAFARQDSVGRRDCDRR